jgi:hypothetical protein
VEGGRKIEKTIDLENKKGDRKEKGDRSQKEKKKKQWKGKRRGGKISMIARSRSRRQT